MSAVTWPTAEGVFEAGDPTIQSGEVLQDGRVVWKTYGTLSANKDNVVLFPTSYGARHADQEWLIGPDQILDPTRWFIVIANMFGNGLSSSPSNTSRYPPLVTVWDNVQVQCRLLSEVFGIERIACVYGWSMGGQQAYQWAAAFPDLVDRAVVICGGARTSIHNRAFIAGMKSILEAAPEYQGDGRFAAQPTAALRAFSRSYAPWALSQDFYRAELHKSAAGAADLESFLRTDWEARYMVKNAADLYAQLKSWEANDISQNPLYDGDLALALGAIRARMLLMPGTTDLYFRVADNELEARHLKNAELLPIESVWGHRAGNPSQNREDFKFLRKAVHGFLGGSERDRGGQAG